MDAVYDICIIHKLSIYPLLLPISTFLPIIVSVFFISLLMSHYHLINYTCSSWAPLQTGQMIFFHTEVKKAPQSVILESCSSALTLGRQSAHDTGVQFQYAATADVGSSNIIAAEQLGRTRVFTTLAYHLSPYHFKSAPLLTCQFKGFTGTVTVQRHLLRLLC